MIARKENGYEFEADWERSFSRRTLVPLIIYVGVGIAAIVAANRIAGCDRKSPLIETRQAESASYWESQKYGK